MQTTSLSLGSQVTVPFTGGPSRYHQRTTSSRPLAHNRGPVLLYLPLQLPRPTLDLGPSNRHSTAQQHGSQQPQRVMSRFVPRTGGPRRFLWVSRQPVPSCFFPTGQRMPLWLGQESRRVEVPGTLFAGNTMEVSPFPRCDGCLLGVSICLLGFDAMASFLQGLVMAIVDQRLYITGRPWWLFSRHVRAPIALLVFKRPNVM